MTIPFDRFLNVRQAYCPSWTPDGERIAFVSNITGVPQAWLVPAAGGWPEPLTFGEDRVLAAVHAPVGDVLLFARDQGGNENAQLYTVSTAPGALGADETALTNAPSAMHIFGGWAPGGRLLAYTANVRNPARYDLYVHDLETGEATLVWQNDQPGFVYPAGFSPNGGRVLVMLMHSAMNADLYEVTLLTRDVRHLTPHDGQVRYLSAVYAADGRAVYCACDRDHDRAALTRLDLADLSLAALAEPEGEVETVSAAPEGRWLAWTENHDGAHRLRARDLETGATLTAPLPAGTLFPAPHAFAPEIVFAPGGRRVAFAYNTPTRTADIWVWDLEANTARQVTRSTMAGIPAGALTEPELIRYPTFDGLEIPAWYYRAAGEAGPRPVVVYVHGGPEGQTTAMFSPVLQYLAHRGYSVLAPNVRGSSGYGKTYLNLDNVEKRMDSVADLAHAVYWLRQQPDVDGDRIAVYGGSYGGFMVLAALTTYPDLWAAGVDVVGIANFVTFLQNTSPYRRSVREAEYGSLARDRAFLESISPIHKVDQIRAPLMIIHGANDPRVPLSETEQMVAALQARGVPVEFLVYPDEGHGLVKLANKLDAYPKMAAFLDRHCYRQKP